jgi:alkylation response protein AidB-like acyl-CoA dehydrogenase
MDPRCRVAIVLGRTASSDDKTVPRHKQHSMIIVPMDTPGLKVVRPLTVFGTYTILNRYVFCMPRSTLLAHSTRYTVTLAAHP